MTKNIERFSITRADFLAARQALSTTGLNARFDRVQIAMGATPIVVNGIVFGVDRVQAIIHQMPANFFSGKDVAMFMGSVVCSTAVNACLAHNILSPLHDASEIVNAKNVPGKEAVSIFLGPKNLDRLKWGVNAINSGSTSLAIFAASASQKICAYGLENVPVDRPMMAGALAFLAVTALAHQMVWTAYLRRPFKNLANWISYCSDEHGGLRSEKLRIRDQLIGLTKINVLSQRHVAPR